MTRHKKAFVFTLAKQSFLFAETLNLTMMWKHGWIIIA